MKAILFLLVTILITGCQTFGGGTYSNQSAEKPIFVSTPIRYQKIYVEYSNTTQADFSTVQGMIEQALQSRGLQVTRSQNEATLILKAKTYRMQAKQLNAKGPVLGAVVGALLGSGKKQKKYIRNGAVAGYIASSAMDDRDYQWTTEIMVLERSDQQHTQSEYGSARNGYARTSYSSKTSSNWKTYRTQKSITATKGRSVRMLSSAIANTI